MINKFSKFYFSQFKSVQTLLNRDGRHQEEDAKSEVGNGKRVGESGSARRRSQGLDETSRKD